MCGAVDPAKSVDQLIVEQSHFEQFTPTQFADLKSGSKVVKKIYLHVATIFGISLFVKKKLCQTYKTEKSI